jgi:hypothetical protein
MPPIEGHKWSNYDVAVVDINDLYNSFGYGLDYNPMAVKNFANYLGLTGKSRFFLSSGEVGIIRKSELLNSSPRQ